MIEQVNTKEVEINVDLKDEASKDTAKGEKLSGDDESHNGHQGEIDEEEERRRANAAAAAAGAGVTFLGMSLVSICICIMPSVCFFGCLGLIVYIAVKAAKD
ncbi:hypothetical protein Mgra_00009987 [Meloidogyne graminicola]|uniref:Transmembrane protein n=1 Tax=Meloidogyne graminicola TaxID=189291 RepID=A0A8S9Z8P7_9BILA|nr:hypothetical protein Mgra_00009987 [Meloidogyne graminicola]